ncbi:MAG: 3,4-dehydroadipyl-CoA semialdehyde dehydrogenase [Planctomycetota bacterium]|jgi:oxepin-CoA hydrolase/3-oxo-5,6-dehydrosuberyl-CoA semialdehyde dehydrogenase
MITLKSWLCGEWREGGGTASVLVNPATEEEIARTSTEGLDLAAAATYAREVGGPALRNMTFAERAEMLRGMSKALFAKRDELLDLAVANGGNTRSDAKFDVDGAMGTLSAYAEIGAGLGDRKILLDGEGIQLGRTPRWWGQHVLVAKEGVAVLINAFNFPAWGFGEKAACALLAGMPVIAKPATSTSLLTFRMIEVLDQAGILPPGSVQLVAGSAGDLLSHLREQDVVAFTGSADTARRLKGSEDLLRHGVPINVEADSLNSAVLAGGVDPEGDTYNLFMKDVARELTQKAGQKCTAVRRILVPAEDADRVQADLAERLSAVKVGDPSRSEVRMGPLTTARQLADGRAGIEKLSAAARVVLGGPEPTDAIGVESGQGYFLAPTLLFADDPASADVVHTHEVFGPVATILPYDGSPEEAAALVARGEGSLVSSAYGDDRDWLEGIVIGLAPWNGRLYLGSEKVAEAAFGSGAALPGLIHGGPGRAGGGEELGGLRGMRLYQQRTALQGDRGLLVRMFPAPKE